MHVFSFSGQEGIKIEVNLIIKSSDAVKAVVHNFKIEEILRLLHWSFLNGNTNRDPKFWCSTSSNPLCPIRPEEEKTLR